MAWRKWDVFIHLGTSDTWRDEPQRHIGVVKGRNEHEAERKGHKLATRRGLSGLIEVRPTELSECQCCCHDGGWDGEGTCKQPCDECGCKE